MDTGFLAAILVAAVLVYDRLGGNHEVSRRLFQVGLAVALVFAVVSGAAAYDGSSQNFDVGAFVTAVVGTIVLLGYGMQLERDFALDSEQEETDTDASGRAPGDAGAP